MDKYRILCRTCKHGYERNDWLCAGKCYECGVHNRNYEPKEDKELVINIDTKAYAQSVFRTPKEANEALAQKYGNGKDYNKMNLNKNISVNIGGKYFRPISVDAQFNKFEYPRYNIEVEVNPMFMIAETSNPNTLIKNVIFNPPATIVFWADNSKTVVKTQDEEFDPEKGLAMAFFKKSFGNKGNYFNEIKKWTEPYYEKQLELTKVLVEAILESQKAKSDDECQTK